MGQIRPVGRTAGTSQQHLSLAVQDKNVDLAVFQVVGQQMIADILDPLPTEMGAHYPKKRVVPLSMADKGLHVSANMNHLALFAD